MPRPEESTIDGAQPGLPGISGQGSNGSSNACLHCRKVKMKCRLEGLAAQCERCRRKGFECSFLQHRRGRKRHHTASTSNSSHQSGQHDSWTALGSHTSSTLGIGRPPAGRFSLENVLTTDQDIAGSRSAGKISEPFDDPILKGLVNQAVAANLFDSFISHLNPFISQLDPPLHTLQYVRQQSSFLLTAILSAAAKTFNPSLHHRLRQHAESLFAQNFPRGEKSPEIIQAILILTYWKEPDDTRAFVSVGLAIRMAIELGWHSLTPETEHTIESTELRKRQIRNIQRTWLVLFVYDRSISMQTGKPWMIEASPFIQSVDAWRCSPDAIVNDSLLGAFVQLRLITSNFSELLEQSYSDQARLTEKRRALLNTISGQIRQWKAKWTGIAETDAHRFLVNFYGAHLLFTLWSIPLQQSLPQAPAIMEAGIFWNSFEAATDLLSSVSEQAASSTLYFMQDSLHVMIAHAVVFLIKLLLCVDKHARNEIEYITLSTLRAAAQAFASQAAPTNSGCGLQAKFLQNVVALVAKLGDGKDPITAPNESLLDSNKDHSVHIADVRHLLGANLNGAQQPAAGFSQVQDQGSSGDAERTSDPPEATQDANFFDDEMWSTMFASAGFDIHEDAFLLDETT